MMRFKPRGSAIPRKGNSRVIAHQLRTLLERAGYWIHSFHLPRPQLEGMLLLLINQHAVLRGVAPKAVLASLFANFYATLRGGKLSRYRLFQWTCYQPDFQVHLDEMDTYTPVGYPFNIVRELPGGMAIIRLTNPPPPAPWMLAIEALEQGLDGVLAACGLSPQGLPLDKSPHFPPHGADFEASATDTQSVATTEQPTSSSVEGVGASSTPPPPAKPRRKRRTLSRRRAK